MNDIQDASVRASDAAIVLAMTMGGGDILAEAFRFQPDWDSTRNRYQVPDWFRDAKFGIERQDEPGWHTRQFARILAA